MPRNRKLLAALLLAALLPWPLLSQAFMPDEEPEPPRPAAKPKTKPKAKARPKPVQHTTKECITDSAGHEFCREVPASDSAQGERETVADNSVNTVVLQPQMVRLPSGILIGKYEVTQAEWRSVMGSNPSGFLSCGDTCPVEQVSWNDVQDYIEKLNQRTGKRYRLPTEDEWYAACQAGSSSEYCGSDNIDAVAWYESNSGERTHPVGEKSPNAWGLYDMSGNVWEWTDSCYAGDCSHRVNRGGAWLYGPAVVRAAPRSVYDASTRIFTLGFRLAQD